MTYRLLSAIKDIGEFIIERDSIDRLDIVIDRMDGAYYNKVIGIGLGKTGDSFYFLNVRLESFNKVKEMR